MDRQIQKLKVLLKNNLGKTEEICREWDKPEKIIWIWMMFASTPKKEKSFLKIK